MYKLTTKHGDHFYLEHTGQVIATSDRPGYIYSGEWVILGVAERSHSHRIISLTELLEGVDPGHGWIHDVDHGTHRVWGHPNDQRFASLVYIDPVLYECGSCGEHHAWTWNGDCREDKERFPGPEEYAAKVGIPLELVEVVEMQDRVDADLAGHFGDYSQHRIEVGKHIQSVDGIGVVVRYVSDGRVQVSMPHTADKLYWPSDLVALSQAYYHTDFLR